MIDIGYTTSICKSNAFPNEYFNPVKQLISGRVANGDYFEFPLQTIPIHFHIWNKEFTHDFYVMNPPCKFTESLLIENDLLSTYQPFTQYKNKI